MQFHAAFAEAELILAGTRPTIVLTIGAIVLGSIIAALLAGVASTYILVIQPMLVLMVLFTSYYGLSLVGIQLPAFFAASTSIAIYSSAHLAEIWRGSIEAVPFQQWKGSESRAMTSAQQHRCVIMPQAVRISLPPTVAFLAKTASIVLVVGFVELSRAGALVNNATFKPFHVFATVAVIYFLICFPLSGLSRHLEKVMNAGRGH